MANEVTKKKTAPTKAKTIVTQKKSVGEYWSLGSALNYAKQTVRIDKNTFFDLYKRNADIRQAINKISLWVAKNGLYREVNGEAVDETNVKGTTLTDQVNDFFGVPTQMFFKKELFKQLLLAGELYLLPIRAKFTNELINFQILDARTMTKKYDTAGELIGFEQRNKLGDYKPYTRDDIAFYKFENDTDNENDGMGLLEGIIRDALSDMESSKRNYYFFENDATPGGMLLLNDEMAAEEMQLAKEMFEEQYKGTKNAHKTMVVGGAKDYKTISMNHKDMEFINQRKLTTDKVASAFGVPKSILGYIEGTNYSNGKEMKLEFIDGTVRPYEKFYEYIINSLLQKFDPKTDYGMVMCDGETLDDRESIEKSQREDLQLGIQTLNEIRKERGLEEYGDANANLPLMKTGIVLLEDIMLDPVLNTNQS